MVPSFGDAFSLAELPRIADLPLNRRVVVPELLLDAENAVHLGISKLIILSYVLDPSPKLVWSFPLSPNTVVNTLDRQNDMYAVGVVERKKKKVLLVEKLSQEETATGQVALDSAPSGVYFGEGIVHVLTADGQFAVVLFESKEGKVEVLPPKEARGVLKVSAKSRVLYHKFLDQEQPLLLYVYEHEKKRSVRLVGLAGERSYEIYHTDLNIDADVFCCGHGSLYALKDGSVTVLLVMAPNSVQKTVQVPAESCAMEVPAPGRLLVSSNTQIFLLNLHFDALLDTFTGSGQLHMQYCASDPNCYALVLENDTATKTTRLNHISVNVGQSTLRECVGKALSPGKTQWSGVPRVSESDLAAADASGRKQLTKTYNKLKNEQLATKFDEQLIEFFAGNHSRKDPKYKETDRIVDGEFVKLLVDLCLEPTEEGVALRKPEKEGALLYLLTHPLFPPRYARGLLLTFSEENQPVLLERAISHCQALLLDDLMAELLNLVDLSEETDEGYVKMFLTATVNRVVGQFTLKEITEKLQSSVARDADDNKRLERMLGVFMKINTKNSWDLVQAVVDAGGLFNWTTPVIDSLDAVLNDKIDALHANSYNLTLVHQVLQLQGKTTKRRTVQDNIHEDVPQKEELDALLTMSDATPRLARLKIEEVMALQPELPLFSKEKLLL